MRAYCLKLLDMAHPISLGTFPSPPKNKTFIYPTKKKRNGEIFFINRSNSKRHKMSILNQILQKFTLSIHHEDVFYNQRSSLGHKYSKVEAFEVE